MRYREYHDEVVDALRAIGNAKLGEAIRDDRGSRLEYLGVRFPDMRIRVKAGFSFSDLPAAEVITIWDDLWHASPFGDVLFAAMEACSPSIRKHSETQWWPTLRTWLPRVDNWCHCDQLAGLYSHLMEHEFDLVYPQVVEWNQSDELWLRRASLVSLVHYTGKNAVFLAPDHVFPLIENCLRDNRHYVQTAVGWVLREMSRPYNDDVIELLEVHMGDISSKAFDRVIEGLDAVGQVRLRDMKGRRPAG